LNIFLEPQFTAVHYGAGQPVLQIFGGINIQFPKERGQHKADSVEQPNHRPHEGRGEDALSVRSKVS
jgi:hypothetical protein